MEKLKLPVHDHPLYQLGGNYMRGNTGRSLSCAGCQRDSHLDSGYRCSQCPLFYLHKKCGESVPEINHPSHPEHPLQLLVDVDWGVKTCSLCGLYLNVLCYHCSICDFTLETGCAINPPLPIIEQPKAHEHTLTLMSSTGVTCQVCGDYCNREFMYLCTLCNLYFHIECASLSPEINHPSHPRHLLKLIEGGSSTNHSDCCILCGKDIGRQNCYHCSMCNFTVDLRCVKNPPPLVLVSPRTHKHQLTCMPRPICFTCNACGKQGDQSPYVCIQCSFMIHRSCIDLPRVIWINRHDHQIYHTYELNIVGHLDLECGVCHESIDSSFGAYSCLKCRDFAVHSRCATKCNVWNGRDLEGEPEEIEDVASFKIIGYNLIKHFTHEEHDMEFVEAGSIDGETITCRACIKPINVERFNKCMECDFSLHEFCANLPRKIRSMLFPEKLILVGGAPSFHDTFCCSPCGRFSSGFRYINRRYVVEIECILTTEPLKREAHPHPLYNITAEVPKVNCSTCGEKKTFGFECLKKDCAFSLHFKCAILPERVKHKSDDHALRLCYREYGNGKFWCDICEKELDFYKQYYTCDDCGTTLHVKCVLGDMFGNISPGSTITRKGYNMSDFWGCGFKVVSNNGINRPLCCVCHSRCTFSLIIKTDGDPASYICSSDCVASIF